MKMQSSRNAFGDIDDEFTYNTESRFKLDTGMVNSPSKVTVFTGTSQLEQEKAERTYMNALGPGAYSLPPLTGRFSIESKRRNIPALTFGQKVHKVGWHPDLATDFVG